MIAKAVAGGGLNSVAVLLAISVQHTPHGKHSNDTLVCAAHTL